MFETTSVSWMFCTGEEHLEVAVAGHTARGCAVKQSSSRVTQDPVLGGISSAEPGKAL